MFHQIFVELLLGAKYCASMYMLRVTQTGPVFGGLVSTGYASVTHKLMVCVRGGLLQHCGLPLDLSLSGSHWGNFPSELNLIGDNVLDNNSQGLTGAPVVYQCCMNNNI